MSDHARNSSVRAYIRDGVLKIDAPRSVLTTEALSRLRKHRRDLLKQLLDGDSFERWDERAAIFEFDAGMPKDIAETAALRILCVSTSTVLDLSLSELQTLTAA